MQECFPFHRFFAPGIPGVRGAPGIADPRAGCLATSRRMVSGANSTMNRSHGTRQSLTTRHGTNTRFYPSRNADAGLRDDRQRFLESAGISLGVPSLFYASLRNSRVFEAVTGRSIDDFRWERAAIRGYRLGIAKAGPGLPGLFPAAGHADAEIDCVLVHGLGRYEETMIAWYEWDEYVLHRITLADGRTAQVFMPDPGAIRLEYGPFDIGPWSLETWQSSGLDRAVADAREWMAQRPDDCMLASAGFCAPQDFPGDERAAG